ncbi:MAG TPA: hydantoinase/oxoprolinase family protein [Acetobacteraceae bacterium]|nr:hydantoinase/oxoprolinase family protein [Acetobacteraceae bacterium]
MEGDGPIYLGVDIGGTFTDLIMIPRNGRMKAVKTLTTPGDLETGVLSAVRLMAETIGIAPRDLLQRVEIFGHGTTQATNALIERKGTRTGLITTRGFGDTIGLQRLLGLTVGLSADQLGWYSKRRYPEPIVPRTFRREVPERVDHAGRVLLALDEGAARKAVAELAAAGVKAFAVALLWSFRNPAHERRIGEIIRETCPDAYVTLSSEISPIIGEYERTAATVLNSYLAPSVAGYLGRVEGVLRESGFRGKFYILNSVGGVMPAREAARKPVLLLASGPAGGVLGSLQLAKFLGYRNVITTDMGGTSFDVSLIVDGKVLISSSHEAGGYHLNTPMIDIRAVGAGGGSIARVENGLLRIGPESAGAKPGPVCYGLGGLLPTVTDANVVLGIISSDNFLGGRMKLDRKAAEEAIRREIAEPLGLCVEEAAAGIVRVVDAHMADILRGITIGRGYDPRDFVIFAYGGAGPAHCTGFGSELGARRIVIPATSMVHSAYGALASDIHESRERSLLMRGGGGRNELWEGIDAVCVAEVFAELDRHCLAAIEDAGIAARDTMLVRTIDMRYRRQTHDLTVVLPPGPVGQDTIRAAVAQFETDYEAAYGRGAGFREAGIELTIFRSQATGRPRKPELSGSGAKTAGRPGSRNVFDPIARRWVPMSVWQWLDLPAGHRLAGPAIIEHPETTVYVGAGHIAVLHPAGHLSIDLAGGDPAGGA